MSFMQNKENNLKSIFCMFDNNNNDNISCSNGGLYIRFRGLTSRKNSTANLAKPTYIKIYPTRYSIHTKIYISKYLYINSFFVCQLYFIVILERDNNNQEFYTSKFLIQYNYILYYAIANSCQFLLLFFFNYSRNFILLNAMMIWRVELESCITPKCIMI
jgi:hypothetical protein